MEYIDFVLILPVLLFMLLDDPHDCFVCLGKDPDRIYSSLQLSKEERMRRKMKAKYNHAQVAQLGDSRNHIRLNRNNTIINYAIIEAGMAGESSDEESFDEDIIYRYAGSLTTHDNDLSNHPMSAYGRTNSL